MTPAMMCMLLDCAEMCQTTANCMMRGSMMCKQMCEVCAAMCTKCAEMCMMMSDMPQMMACAECCRRCAECCTQMTMLAMA